MTALATALAGIHRIRPTIEVRAYQSWAWEAKYVVPDWARRPKLWQDAFDLLRTEPPAFAPTFLHGDFQLRNILWTDDSITGIVDWVETSIGPAWLDVAHCCSHMSLQPGGADAAARFASEYIRITGQKPQPYFDVMDIVGFLPAPGRQAMTTDLEEQHRLEDRLATTLD